MKANVSVIVPTKNEEANIRRCLKSIKNQKEVLEIIVVDNFSQDQTTKIAKQYTSKVYSVGPERSTQRNFGLKVANAPFAVFIDADMEMEKGLLEECLQVIKNDPATVAIVIDEISKGNNFWAHVKSLEKQLTTKEETIESPRFFDKYALVKIGAYDENLVSGEDWDLAIRVKKFGKIARIKKDYHHEKGSILADIKKKYYYARFISKYASKHPKEFKIQSGYKRFTSLFKIPRIILENPFEFAGLLLLKALQYLAYITALSKLRLENER